MIPVKLTLKGFLSYRQEVELDFEPIDLACVIGQNGAGKSSLLDAITWALFGRARSSDDDLVNLQEDTATVILEFDYEDQRYRVERIKKRGSSKKVQLNVWNPEKGTWRDFSEGTSRDTQFKLESILRMDYDTFINASFFLQGKADQFAQQKPTDRKRTLAKILELDIWELYQKQVAVKRRELETDLKVLDARLEQIEADLGREDELKDELSVLTDKLAQIEQLVETQEKLVEGLKKFQQQMEHQQEQLRILAQHRQSAQNRLETAQKTLTETESKQTHYQGLLAHENDVKAQYEQWQAKQKALDAMDATAVSFNAISKRREEPLQRLIAEETRLNSEVQHLSEKAAEMQAQEEKLVHLREELAETMQEQARVREEVSRYVELEERFDTLDFQKREIEPVVLELMGELKRLTERKRKLEKLDAVECPTCGQPLTEIHRKEILSELNETGRSLKASYEEKKAVLDQLQEEMDKLQSEIKQLKQREETELVRRINVKIASHHENIERMTTEIAAWHEGGEKEFAALQKMVTEESFCQEERDLLQAIEAELGEMGYDLAKHEALRVEVQEGRQCQQDYQALNEAKGVLAELETVYAAQQKALAEAQQEVESAEGDYQQAEAVLAELESSAGDYTTETRKLMQLRDDRNLTRQSVGGAEQKLNALVEKRAIKKSLREERKELTQTIDRHKLLEDAFGKNGVPALLIEQAIPDIQDQANKILDRLSTSGMMVQLRTQAEYKDTNRKDRKETLDIVISDQVGVRPYEMYSGGEAFRVNFAIRLALSRILAARTGARLQTLVIDEGFGSQDADGVQRLVSTINAIKDDFSKIIVITHLEALKGSFPTQIEVVKVPGGSQLQVVQA